MSNEKSLLTFELYADGSALSIHGNADGFKALCSVLTHLIERGTTEHVHMMSPAWGGGSLSEDHVQIDTTLLNHANIQFWSSEDVMKIRNRI